MLRVSARVVAGDEMSGHIFSERDNISGGNLLPTAARSITRSAAKGEVV
jgi:hypothetical protein